MLCIYKMLLYQKFTQSGLN